MKRVLYRWITGFLLVGCMTGIFMFSAQPGGKSGKISGSVSYQVVELCDGVFHIGLTEEKMEKYAQNIDYPVRKAAHMTEYAVLGVLVLCFLLGYEGLQKKPYLLSHIIASIYAISDEVHQLFVPGRSGRFGDVCIDAIGAALGLLLVYVIRKKLGKHCEKKKLPLQ